VLLLIRHGETEWSATRRHTGNTDVELTERGRAQARALQPLLATIEPAAVVTSPRRRAMETCRLAGFADRARVDDRLVEWDYGDAEGRTTAEMREEIPGWSVWTHPLPGGETIDAVADRVDALLADLAPADDETDVLLFGHAHLFRILAARWIGLPPSHGQHLVLDPGTVSRLGHERETPCIDRWNVAPR
jgi:broad specificity phosphatase PhoE